MKHLTLVLSLAVLGCAQVALAQQTKEPVPVINIKVARSVKAISYRAKGGATNIGFQGTALLPRAEGKAKVESKGGVIKIEAEFSKLEPATKFGPAYLTYILWAITPEGHANNLGELQLDGNKSKLNTTTRLQSFGMIVTAEPYFAVTFPSEQVVLENVVRPETVGQIETVDAKIELLQRGQYDALNLEAFRLEPKVPLELYQARNAMRIAKTQQADQYAADSWTKAQRTLESAESYQKRKGNNRKAVIMSAREAVQTAEDARIIGVKRIEDERAAQERRAAAEREAQAKAETEAEARRRAEAEARRKAEEEARQRAEAERAAAEKQKTEAELVAAKAAEEKARAEAERAAAEKQKTEAELAAAKAAEEKARAEAARQAALAQEQQAKAEAERARLAAESARAAAEKAERDRQALRVQLLEQFNRILPTRDTPRGLLVTMAGILFDTGKYNLRPAARESLAKLSGIVLAHPGLKLEVEGHTDNVGGDEFNQRLSEKRAETVREYLIGQGLSADSITSKGFGKTMPVASNDTAKGRQQNRRVEIIVSGEVIGTKIGGARTSQ